MQHFIYKSSCILRGLRLWHDEGDGSDGVGGEHVAAYVGGYALLKRHCKEDDTVTYNTLNRTNCHGLLQYQ